MNDGHRPPRLQLEGVTKEYGGDDGHRLSALTEMSVRVEPGEFVSVEGPSGCGKTTFLNLLGLLDRPTRGRVLWDGEPTDRWRERERARHRLTGVGFIFQRFYLLPTLTAIENVALPMRPLGGPARVRESRARELLDRVGLSGRAGAYPHELSGGEEQRVAIARALANRPGLLLADEPTGELDSTNAAGILELLVDAHRSLGATVVLVTHNPSVAARAGRHLTMADGRLVADRSGD